MSSDPFPKIFLLGCLDGDNVAGEAPLCIQGLASQRSEGPNRSPNGATTTRIPALSTRPGHSPPLSSAASGLRPHVHRQGRFSPTEACIKHILPIPFPPNLRSLSHGPLTVSEIGVHILCAKDLQPRYVGWRSPRPNCGASYCETLKPSKRALMA